jgi:hypothetical protein
VTVEERTGDFDLLTAVARRWVPAVFGVVPKREPGGERLRPARVRRSSSSSPRSAPTTSVDSRRRSSTSSRHLPSWIRASAEVLYHVGSVGTVVVLAFALLFTRRFRLLLL